MSVKQNGSHEILKKDNLVGETVKLLMGSGEKPSEKKMGIEVEMPFVKKKNLKPIPFSGKKSITAIFNGLVKQGAWAPAEVENGVVTALKGEAGNVTLEPGGQIEFASAPRTSLKQLAADVAGYCADLKHISKKLKVDVVPYGFLPHVPVEDCPYISERTRFAALKPVFEAERGFAAWGQSSSVQMTLDGKTMDDSFGAFKLGLLLQPVAAAMFANSPFSLGEDSGFKSWRRQNLLALDSPYYSVPDKLFDKDFTIHEWADHVLHVPMSFVVRNDQYIAVAPHPFIDMIGKPLPELAHLPAAEQYLSKADLLDHTTGIKPEMLFKPNQLLEFRAADLGPSPAHWLSLGAFWVGLFYDKEAYQAAQDYVADWSADERKAFRDAVAKDGLAAEIHGRTAQQIALDLIAIAKQGLQKVEPQSVAMLDVLETQVKSGQTPAENALAVFAQNDNDMEKTLKQTFLFAPKKQKKGGLGL